MLLEICAYNIQSCIIAEKAGASRIELCADASAGGITPSYGTVSWCLENLSIPVFPMVRPRGGNFIYSDEEVAIMEKDILAFRELGCPGVVLGVLLQDGNIDVEQMKRLVDLAHPMEVTCHKAFDRTNDAFNALEALIRAGCSRVLTSGLRNTALEGVPTLAALIAQAAGRINIMPGGGVRSSNLAWPYCCYSRKGIPFIRAYCENRRLCEL